MVFLSAFLTMSSSSHFFFCLFRSLPAATPLSPLPAHAAPLDSRTIHGALEFITISTPGAIAKRTVGIEHLTASLRSPQARHRPAGFMWGFIWCPLGSVGVVSWRLYERVIWVIDDARGGGGESKPPATRNIANISIIISFPIHSIGALESAISNILLVLQQKA